MNDIEISKQLNADYDTFLYGVYEGMIPPPQDIVELFKIGVVAMPPFAHKVMFLKVKKIAVTPVSQLTNSDLNDIIKVVVNVPMERLYPDLTFEKIVDKGIRMDRFILSYNNHIEAFKNKLVERQKSLTDLTSGVRGNGMRIIQNG